MIWFERQRSILDFTLSSLLRRKGKNLALIAVYSGIIFLLASVMFFTHAVRREAALVLQDAPEIVVQRLVAGRHDLMPAAYLAKVEGLTGVAKVRGRLWGYYFDPLFGSNYTLMVPEKFEQGEGNVAIGQGVARSSFSQVDNILPFRTHTGSLTSFIVSQILPAESELLSADLVLMSESDFRSLFGIKSGYFTDFAVTVRNPREVATVADKISKALPDTRPITRAEILRTYETIFNWRGGIMLVILAAALFAFIIFAWDRASGLSAEEKREIGILKAIGWETSDVILMKLWEGGVISLSSFIIGVIFAYLHVFFASSALFEPALKGWSVLYPDFRLVSSIDGLQLATLFFLSVIPYTVATLVPSWKTATIDPDAVMRS